MSLPESEYLSSSAVDADESVASDVFDEPSETEAYEPSERTDYDGQQLDREERQSLRRVAGMSTELTDITEVEYRQLLLERVVLVSVWTTGSEVDAENAMAELKLLAETAGSEVLEGVVQRRQRPDPATYIGRGKVEELREIVVATGADTVICDGELAPAQLRNLEDKVKVKVIDRTSLILDIFASARQERGGARLRSSWPSCSTSSSDSAAGVATSPGRPAAAPAAGPASAAAGPVRRSWRPTVAGSTAGSRSCGPTLRELDANRQLKRAERRRHQVPSVAIVGYTNAGKSSVLNRLTGAGVLVEDALFATLDPTTRRTQTTDGRVFTLTDTVGFVRHLPHDLVEAFASTLEESAQADLLVHVVDASDPDPVGQISAVRGVLADIGAGDVPELIVLNKCDRASAEAITTLRTAAPGAVVTSARTGEGIEELRAVVESRLPRPERRGAGAACRTSGAIWSTGSTSAVSWSAWSTPSTARW